MLDTNSFILLLVLLFIIASITVAVAIIVIVSNRKLMATNNINKQQNNMLKGILEKLVEDKDTGSNNKKNNDEHEKSLMNTFVKLRTATKENCVATMNQIAASRIAIYLFHNGTHSSHGVNFFKMSCICEKVAIGSGVRERMMEHTNIPINLFDDMIGKLLMYNRYIIINDENISETDHKIFISADKIKYVQLISIYDLDNNILGFVAAEMDKPYSKDEADEEKKTIDELVKQLVPVLSYSDYKLKTSTTA